MGIRVRITYIKNISGLKGQGRYRTNFSDGTGITVRANDPNLGDTFPFKVIDASGMLVHIFEDDKRGGKILFVLFGSQKKEGSVALNQFYEWSEENGFDHYPSDCWKRFWSSPELKIIDGRKPGGSPTIKINEQGDIMSP